MGQRKELKNIANGLINSFISRNNDVFGYWGIGKLYSHMLNSDKMKITIDLIHNTIDPKSVEFRHLISEYSNRLMEQIEKRKIKKEYLTKAEILLSGHPNEPNLIYGQLAPNRMNCKLIITTDALKF